MKLLRTKRFLREYHRLPQQLRDRTDEKLRFLVRDIAHPSLRVKPVRGRPGLYEGSINMQYRFLFAIAADTYTLLHIGKHEIIDES